MIWRGYTPYQQFIQKLMLTNRPLAQLKKHQTLSFKAAKAHQFYTNTPQRASSTFVRNISYFPNARICYVNLGNSQYVYPMSRTMLSRWLTSRSLGRFYNRHIKLS